MPFKPLPIGVDNFEDLIKKGYYYVDKTLFIKELIDMRGEANLFTRPRRFGKTLNISMIKYFFDVECSDAKQLFEGLAIMRQGEEYTKLMSKYPVISLSFKSMKQSDFELSYMQMKKMIAEEYTRHDHLLKWNGLTESDKQRYTAIRDVQGSDSDYLDSLKFLSACLTKYYGQKTIILIDEYDVPLENSYFGGFYDRMIAVIRSLLESALKTNEYLEFAVITGCLRTEAPSSLGSKIPRQVSELGFPTKLESTSLSSQCHSIFTGLNNLKVISITNPIYAEHFGFTEDEVREMLHFYERDDCMDTVKTWYDGYLFGNTEVYNPWSVINYMEQLWFNPKAFPQPYWSNTSSNSIVRTLVEGADIRVKQEIEVLIQGESIEKAIHEDITYDDIGPKAHGENLWNFLYFTGYLKKTAERMDGNVRYISMAIPNEEVKYIYKNTVLSWFDQRIRKRDLSHLYNNIVHGNVAGLEKNITDLLREGISFYDTRESFYHGFLMGLLNGMDDFYAYSNREAGDGRYDICLKSLDVEKPVIIFELKMADSYMAMADKSIQAVQQIEMKHYEEGLIQDGFQKVLCYGIAFYKKNCKISIAEKIIRE